MVIGIPALITTKLSIAVTTDTDSRPEGFLIVKSVVMVTTAYWTDFLVGSEGKEFVTLAKVGMTVTEVTYIVGTLPWAGTSLESMILLE